jgi:SAM-dependent methyltransferase
MSAANTLTKEDYYDPHFFDELFAVEDRHFWFRARNGVLSAVLRQLEAKMMNGYRVLEVGCGTGNVLRVLERICRRGLVIGMDCFAEGLRCARRRVACPLVHGDLHHAPFTDPFHLIGMFDVLEHLPDDRDVLNRLYPLLADGGTLLLTVPAHLSLWSYFDEASCHYRRYELRDLTERLTGAGYQVEYATEFMTSIFPLVWAGRRLAELRRRFGRRRDTDKMVSDELKVVPLLNEILARMLALEVPLIARRRRLPFGTSLLAIAHKPPASSMPLAA